MSADSVENLTQHASFLRRLAEQTTASHDVEDLVQDCLLVGLEKGPRDPSRTTGWFRRVLTHRAIENHRRNDRRRQREKRRARSETQPSALEIVEHRSAVRRVAEAVTALESDLYDVIRLRYFDGLSIQEIADARGLSTRSVRYRLELALKELRKKLDARPEGRAAIALLAGISSNKVLDLGGWLAMKKVFASLLIVLLAFGAWTMWDTWQEEDTDLDSVTVESTERQETAVHRFEGKEQEGAASETTDSNEFTIDRQRDIFGRVVDEQGNPIPGAAIESRKYPWRTLDVLSPRSQEYEVVDQALSNQSGAFQMRHERGDVVRLHISKAGYASLILTQRVAGEKLEVVLKPAAKLVVRVQSDDGEPVADAFVSTWRTESKKAGNFQFDQRRGKTNKKGEFIVSDLGPGLINIHVGHGSFHYAQFQKVELALGRDATSTFLLRRAGVIRGRVVDDRTGEGVAGAKITAGWRSHAVVSDEQGHFERPGVPTEERQWFDLEAKAKGYAAGRLSTRFTTDDVEIRLKKGDAVIGQIQDESGQPVEGVMVSMIGSKFSAMGQVLDMNAVKSDATGQFVLSDVSRDLPHTLIFARRGFGRQHLDFDPNAKTPGTIDLGVIVLKKALSIAGHVLQDDGIPVANALITLKGSNKDRLRLRHAGAGPSQKLYGNREERRTDDLGRFYFGGLPSATFELELKMTGRVPEKLKVELADKSVDDVSFVVSAPKLIQVQVVDQNHDPLPAMTVELSSKKKILVTEKTDLEGIAKFDARDQEELAVRVQTVFDSKFRRDGYTLVELDGSMTVIMLKEKVLVEGRVLDPDGKGLVGHGLEALVDGKVVASVDTQRSGRFQIDVGDVKTVDLRLTGMAQKKFGDFMSTSVPAAFEGEWHDFAAPGKGLILRATTRKNDLSLTILVLDKDEKPLPYARAYVSGLGSIEPSISDDRGLIRLANLTDDELLIRVYPPNGDELHHSARPLKVKPANQEVSMRLWASRKVSGRVTFGDGKPAQRFYVEAKVDGDEHYRALTSKEGGFELTIADGITYEVVAYSKDRKFRGVLKNVTKGPLNVVVKPVKSD